VVGICFDSAMLDICTLRCTVRRLCLPACFKRDNKSFNSSVQRQGSVADHRWVHILDVPSLRDAEDAIAGDTHQVLPFQKDRPKF